MGFGPELIGLPTFLDPRPMPVGPGLAWIPATPFVYNSLSVFGAPIPRKTEPLPCLSPALLVYGFYRLITLEYFWSEYCPPRPLFAPAPAPGMNSPLACKFFFIAKFFFIGLLLEAVEMIVSPEATLLALFCSSTRCRFGDGMYALALFAKVEGSKLPFLSYFGGWLLPVWYDLTLE